MRYLAIDIGTTAQDDIADSPYLSWVNRRGTLSPEEAWSKAGLHAEYGRLCSVAAFWIDWGKDEPLYRKAFSGVSRSNSEEADLLLELQEKVFAPDVILVGHNIKDFVVPFLTKRYLANRMIIPAVLKSVIFEDSYFDTMRELACGGQSVMSLRSAAWMLGIPDPRSEVQSPRYYDLCNAGDYASVEQLTVDNAKVAAEVFVTCTIYGLIEIGPTENIK